MRCHSPRLRLACPACGAAMAAVAGGLACPGGHAAWPEQDGVLVVAQDRVGAPGFDPHFFPDLEQLEQRHFWFVVRRERILERLRRDIPDLRDRALFDIGCGTAGLAAFLARNGVTLAGACDAYPDALRRAATRLDAPLVLVQGAQPPPLAPGQSLISLFDVLEHLDDDRGMLSWLASVLAPGGILVLTVPAHPFLYDEKDRVSHHRRRYARGDLGRKLEAAGFEIRRLEHFMASMVLPRLLGRFVAFGTRASEQGPPGLAIVPGVNRVMHAVLEAERRLTSRLRPPFGTSLLAIAARR